MNQNTTEEAPHAKKDYAIVISIRNRFIYAQLTEFADSPFKFFQMAQKMFYI